MKLSDSNSKYIAPEQFGCRKFHRAIEVMLNSRLVDDIMRSKKQPGIICSNDAKSCFDQIIHAAFAICLKRIGCPEGAIASCIDTLQNLQHHIRTAFGDSEDYYKGTDTRPLKVWYKDMPLPLLDGPLVAPQSST